MAACSREPRHVQSLVHVQDGPFTTQQEAARALALAVALCVRSSAPPCCGECIEKGTPCEPAAEEWDPAAGPFYSSRSTGIGWYFRIPVGMWIAYRYQPKGSRPAAQVEVRA